jgi:hypothetical protein
MKYLAYLNILFGDNHVQNSGNCKKGGCPADHLGIKNRIKKNPVNQLPAKNVTLKNRHIDIIAPNITNFYRQIFKIFKLMFFMEGTQKKINLSRKVISHPSFASLFVCEINK